MLMIGGATQAGVEFSVDYDRQEQILLFLIQRVLFLDIAWSEFPDPDRISERSDIFIKRSFKTTLIQMSTFFEDLSSITKSRVRSILVL